MGHPSDTQSQFIDVDALRVGMFIYLDLGWIGHPFALNSFKITSDGQIETIRALGLKRLRWSPERSDPAEPSAPENEPAPRAVEDVDDRRLDDPGRHPSGLDRCDREFSDATRAFRDVIRSVRPSPETAREQAELLVSGLVDALLDQGESFIRLLSEKAGDQASLHAVNVTVVSLLLGRRLELGAMELRQLGVGALLHDIGKLELPDRLRWLDGGFTSPERKLFQRHVTLGVEMAERMRLGPEAASIIAQHHEHMDGTGFPRQLKQGAISPAACIVALVNHYDNLCNPANPLAAMTPHQALSIIFAQGSGRFDAGILGAFIRMMGVYPPGSVVMLTDGRYALVVSVSSSRPLKPRVIIHDPRVEREEAPVIDLEERPDLGIKQSLKPVQLPRSVFDYLSPRQRTCYFFERARDPLEPGSGG